MGQVPFLSTNQQHFSQPSVLSALCCAFHPSSARYAYQLKQIIVNESKLLVWSLKIIDLKWTGIGEEEIKSGYKVEWLRNRTASMLQCISTQLKGY